MSKQRFFSGAWMVGLALTLAVFLGAPGLGQIVMAADGNHLALEAPSEVRQNETVELIAVVRDSQGRPVKGVSVGFRAESGWEKNIMFAPPRPTTLENGEARTMLTANMTGIVHITAQAGDKAMTVALTVAGSGSSGPGRQ